MPPRVLELWVPTQHGVYSGGVRPWRACQRVKRSDSPVRLALLQQAARSQQPELQRALLLSDAVALGPGQALRSPLQRCGPGAALREQRRPRAPGCQAAHDGRVAPLQRLQDGNAAVRRGSPPVGTSVYYSAHDTAATGQPHAQWIEAQTGGAVCR
jgi:hypothetical protein